MFDVSHEALVAFSRSWGLFYLMGFFFCVIVYALWPANRKRFDRAKTSILDGEDRPCR